MLDRKESKNAIFGGLETSNFQKNFARHQCFYYRVRFPVCKLTHFLPCLKFTYLHVCIWKGLFVADLMYSCIIRSLFVMKYLTKALTIKYLAIYI